jgi:ATP-binding cassette subfamily F protein uup
VATTLGVQPLFERRTDELSGGQAKRVALATILSHDREDAPDLLILDEPTNHLDLEAIEWLEARLAATPSALVLVTHDRHALDRLTAVDGSAGAGAGPPGVSRVVELDGGRAFVHHAAVWSSAYATYLDARAARVEQELQQESTRKILARKELAWLRRGAPARSTKPKARLRSANEIVSGGPRDAGVRSGDLDLRLGTTRLGNQVVELERVAQRFGDHEVFSDVELLIEPGARLAVVGPNGSGKSTLLDVIAGRTEPAAGLVRRGSTVVVGFADQHASELDPDAVVRNLVAGPHRDPDHRDRVLLERFWFDSTAQYAPVRMLSGGERRRLHLVMVLATEPNLLILDEPTNDLDLDTLRALEDFLDDWPGALVVASHDRAFLDRVADHVLAIDGGGLVRRVPGGVSGWLAGRHTVTAAKPRGRSGARSVPGPDASKPTGTSVAAQPSKSTIGRRIRETEQAMTRSERRIGQLTERLAGATDHVALAQLGSELAESQAELDALERRWLELAELREA